jgi:hypothetical protein
MFSQINYTDGWASGKTGITFSLIRRNELQPSQELSELINTALGSLALTLQNFRHENNNTSLNEGCIGSALLLLEAHRVKQTPEYLQTVSDFEEKLWYNFIQGAKNRNRSESHLANDSSLAYGTAGLGYFLTKVCQSQQQNYDAGIMRPDLFSNGHVSPDSLPGVLKIDKTDIVKKIIATAYPRTLALVDQLSEWNDHCNSTDPDPMAAIKHISALSSQSENFYLKDCLQYEGALQRSSVLYKNKVEFCVKRFGDVSTIKHLLNKVDHDTLLTEYKFVLSEDAVVHSSQWPWHTLDCKQASEKESFTLMIPATDNTHVYVLDHAQNTILEKFKTPQYPISVFRTICSENEIGFTELLGLLKNHFFDLVKTGALISCKKMSLTNYFRKAWHE